MSLKSILIVCFCAFSVFTTSCGKEDTNYKDTNNEDTNYKDTNYKDTNYEDTNYEDTNNEDTNNEDTNNASSNVAFEEFKKTAPRLITENLCHAVFTCPEKQSILFISSISQLADKDDCIANLSSVWGVSQFDSEDRALKAGRSEYDPAQAAKCIDYLNKQLTQCSYFTDRQIAVCDSVFIPKVEANEPCASRRECISGVCTFDDDNCYGRCGAPVALATEGQDCTDNECEANLFCVSDTDDYNIKTCVKPGTRQKHESCGYDSRACVGELLCTIANMCHEQTRTADVGQTCDNEAIECKPGLLCTDMQFVDGNFVGTCTASKGINEACASAYECKPDLYCSLESYTCISPNKIGEACEEHYECAAELKCNQETNKCAARLFYTCEFPAK